MIAVLIFGVSSRTILRSSSARSSTHNFSKSIASGSSGLAGAVVSLSFTFAGWLSSGAFFPDADIRCRNYGYGLVRPSLFKAFQTPAVPKTAWWRGQSDFSHLCGRKYFCSRRARRALPIARQKRVCNSSLHTLDCRAETRVRAPRSLCGGDGVARHVCPPKGRCGCAGRGTHVACSPDCRGSGCGLCSLRGTRGRGGKPRGRCSVVRGKRSNDAVAWGICTHSCPFRAGPKCPKQGVLPYGG